MAHERGLMVALSNEKRFKRILKLTGVKYEKDIAGKFGTNQPQISRWKHGGFHGCTNAVIDFLLSIISIQQREINRLKNMLSTK
jgi:hypothetical protein